MMNKYEHVERPIALGKIKFEKGFCIFDLKTNEDYIIDKPTETSKVKYHEPY